MSASEPPPMPEWAPQEGPWCLKTWIPLRVPNALVDTCLREPNHRGDCRGIHGAWLHYGNAIYVGQREMKEKT